jgi:hypothetical protein
MNKQISSLIILILIYTSAQTNELLLLQTFGTKKHTGRTVAGGTERGITIQLSEIINDVLAELEKGPQTFIINPAGDKKRNPLEILNKINQAKQAIVLQLTATQSYQAKPSCDIFYRCYNPLTDQIKRPYAPLTAIPLENVYLLNFRQSKILATALYENLQASNDFIDIRQPIGIPLAGVRGIKHPMIQIELNINKDTQITQLGTILAHSLQKIVLPS